MTTISPSSHGEPIPFDEAPRARSPKYGRRTLGTRLGVDRYSGLYVWFALIVLFSVLEPDAFMTFANARTVSADAAITAVVALGATVALASGAFDLSIGGSMTWGIVGVCWLQSVHGVPPGLAILIVLLSCLVIGAINGLIVVRLHVEPIIATMGTTAIIAAFAFWLQDGQSIVTDIPESFKDIARGDILGLPSTVVYLAVLAVALWYLMTFTPVGRYLYASGGNHEAARLAGLRVDLLTVLAFCISALVAGIAGVLLASKVGSAGIGQGSQYLLPAFAAAFLGSTQFKPGRFNVLGTLVAIYLVVTGTKGLQLVYPGEPWLKDLFTGVALIVAVSIGARSARRVNVVRDDPPVSVGG